MKIFTLLICLTLLISCKKEKDVFNYTISYNNPSPENNTAGINLRKNSIRFSDIERTGLAEYVKEYRVYFDTIYPPVKLLQSSAEELLSSGLPILKTNKTYYWAFSSLIPSGEIWSDIQFFTTSDFSGVWKLESVADKRAMLNSFYNRLGGNFSWTRWSDWSDTSYETYANTINGEESSSYRNCDINIDSLLDAEAEISEINFSKGRITLSNTNENVIASFLYDDSECSMLIKGISNNSDYKFATANVGYISYYDQVVMLLINEQGIMFIYTRA